MTTPVAERASAGLADGRTDQPTWFSDVLVVPFSDRLDYSRGGYDHRGGPIWPDWDSQVGARHRRGGVTIDVEPLAQEPDERLVGPVAWGGPVVAHFGHQLADFSMRLVPTLTADPEATIAFATDPEWGTTIESAPPFFLAILDWLGVRRERALALTTPVVADRIMVLPQAEQHYGPGPSDAHLAHMDALVDRRLPDRHPRSGVLYVSRAGMHARLAGESYLEEALRQAGATVIRPERLPLRDQLEAYAAADTLIFAQGSAIHGARLLGRTLGDVVVLNRLPGDRIAEAAVAPRATSLTYRDPVIGVICGLMPTGEPFEVLGMPVPDEDALAGLLSDIVPGLRQGWDSHAYRTARDADVMAWFPGALDEPRFDGEDSWEHLLTTLERCGLGHLVAGARALMDVHPRRPQPRGASTASHGQDGPAQPLHAAPSPPGVGDPESAGKPWDDHRLTRIVAALKGGPYVDVGMRSGQTFRHVRITDSAYPGAWSEWSGSPGGAVATLARSADDAFVARSAGIVFDVIRIDQPDDVAAYRDVCTALIRTRHRSVIVIDHPSIDAGLRLSTLIGDFHAGLASATVSDERPWTLVWRVSGPSQPGRPAEVPQTVSEDEAFDRWLRDLERGNLRHPSPSIMMPDR